MKTINPKYKEALETIKRHNDKAFTDVAIAFTKTDCTKLFGEKGPIIVGWLTNQIKRAKSGEALYPMEKYYSNILTELLCTNAYAFTDGWGVDDDRDKYDHSISAEEYISDMYVVCANTAASKIQERIKSLMTEYATLGVSLAKSINSQSVDYWAHIIDVMRQHVRDGINVNTMEKPICEMLIAWEAEAVNRLRLDQIIAEIKPFDGKKSSNGVSR